jgi:POT family proton-dependent oligopeptide transporter
MNRPVSANEDRIKRGRWILFFLQMFSTLSYAVFYSTLIFYLTKFLKIEDKMASDITAQFIALGFFLQLLAGFVGGRLFTFRVLFVISMLLQMSGLLLVSIANTTLMYWALAIFLSGNGFNMTCINCMLTQLYEPEDKRREKAFLWNYSSMNSGYFIGFSMGGYFLLTGNYQELFILSGIANLIALVVIIFGWSKLHDTSIKLHSIKKRIGIYLMSFAGLVVLVVLLNWMLKHARFGNILIVTVLCVMFVYVGYLAKTQTDKKSANKILAYLILFIPALFYYTVSQLAPMGFNLFINRNVDLDLFGITLAPQWVQNINPLVIIFGGPVLAVVFHKLRERGHLIPPSFQFSMSLLIIGFSLLILAVGIHFADPSGLSNIAWVIICIALQGVAELCFSPIGYAMIGHLAPAHLRGLLMGNWLTCIGVAAVFADYFSKYALGGTDSMDPLVTNASYSHSFILLGVSTVIAGLILLLLLPFLKRLTHAIK